jgi:hypothetical protein
MLSGPENVYVGCAIFHCAICAATHGSHAAAGSHPTATVEADRSAQSRQEGTATATAASPAATEKVQGALPASPRKNPFANLSFEPTTCQGMRVQKTFKGHSLGIAHVVLHPRKPVAVCF